MIGGLRIGGTAFTGAVFNGGTFCLVVFEDGAAESIGSALISVAVDLDGKRCDLVVQSSVLDGLASEFDEDMDSS